MRTTARMSRVPVIRISQAATIHTCCVVDGLSVANKENSFPSILSRRGRLLNHSFLPHQKFLPSAHTPIP
jgi:hypothetical protein